MVRSKQGYTIERQEKHSAPRKFSRCFSLSYLYFSLCLSPIENAANTRQMYLLYTRCRCYNPSAFYYSSLLLFFSLPTFSFLPFFPFFFFSVQLFIDRTSINQLENVVSPGSREQQAAAFAFLTMRLIKIAALTRPRAQQLRSWVYNLAVPGAA